MRPKVVVPILLLAFAALGTAVILSRPARPEPCDGSAVKLRVAQITTHLPPAEVPAEAVSAPATSSVTDMKPSSIASPAVQETNHAAYVQDRVAELMALAMSNNSNSLNTIWSELSNPDKEIRSGALEAVVQFGDRSVTPRLCELAEQTEDSSEKADIVAAANYLGLPSLTDLHHVVPTNGPP